MRVSDTREEQTVREEALGRGEIVVAIPTAADIDGVAC